MLQGVPDESQPSKLVGSLSSKNRYFDFDKLAEVCLIIYIKLPVYTGFFIELVMAEQLP